MTAMRGLPATYDQDERDVLTVPEAGRRLGLGINGSYAAANRGEIPTLKFGKKLRVSRRALERMLTEGRTVNAA